MGTTVTPNLGLIKPDSVEPAANWPAQVGSNYDKIDLLFGTDLPTSVAFYDQGAYTPTLEADTNPTLGSGSQILGHFVRIGLLVFFKAYWEFGSSGTNAGSGTYIAKLPLTANTSLYPDNEHQSLGAGYASDSSTPANRESINVAYHNTSQYLWRVSQGNFVSANAPFAWGVGDFLSAEGWYIADSGLTVP